MNQAFFWSLLIGALLLQSFFTTIPVVAGVLVVLYIFYHTESLFVIALLTGLVVDTILVYPLGISSLAFLLLLSVMHVYEKKFELQTKEYVFFWSLLGSVGYLFFLGYQYVFQQALASAIVAVLLFLCINVILSHRRRISQ